MSSIRLEGIFKDFHGANVLENINFQSKSGEFVVIVGPSGCGKSTLLRIIAGLERMSAGNVWIDGVCVTDVAPAKRKIAMVFQSYALYPHMTVYENIAFAIEKVPNAEVERRVLRACTMLELKHLLDRLPKELSGGQRQRVAIGRCLVRDPKLFLFDEPLSNLDATLRTQMRYRLARLKQQLKAGMVYVTHDQVEAMTLADRIVVMRDGHVEQVGTPSIIYNKPSTKFVANFIGSTRMNFLLSRLVSMQGANISWNIEGENYTYQCQGVSVGDIAPKKQSSLLLGVRPEHVMVSKTISQPKDGIMIEGELKVLENLGSDFLLHVDVGGVSKEKFLVRCSKALEVEVGEKIYLSFSFQHMHIFDKKTGKVLLYMS
ncbi:MAG: ABC transporter ATP-binding protein [Alphaproteobacteria bacterium]|nr:ABC transporter ATP-binding protein [Alphaproteobacteria bacterium]